MTAAAAVCPHPIRQCTSLMMSFLWQKATFIFRVGHVAGPQHSSSSCRGGLPIPLSHSHHMSLTVCAGYKLYTSGPVLRMLGGDHGASAATAARGASFG